MRSKSGRIAGPVIAMSGSMFGIVNLGVQRHQRVRELADILLSRTMAMEKWSEQREERRRD